MEYGPASRTRSAYGHKPSQLDSPLPNEIEVSRKHSLEDENAFKTPRQQAKKKKGKGRTPSGNPLSSSVEDIRNFFSQEGEYDNEEKSAAGKCMLKVVSNNRRSLNLLNSQGELENGAQGCDTPEWSRSQSQCDLRIAAPVINRLESRKQTNKNLSTSIETSIVGCVNDNGASCNLSEKFRRIGDQKDNYQSEMNVLEKLKQQSVKCQKGFQSIKRKVHEQRQDTREVQRLMQQKEQETNVNSAELSDSNRKEIHDLASNTSINMVPDDTDLPNPGTMNMSIVMDIFRDLKKQITTSTIINGQNRLETIEEVQEFTTDEIERISEELNACQQKK